MQVKTFFNLKCRRRNCDLSRPIKTENSAVCWMLGNKKNTDTSFSNKNPIHPSLQFLFNTRIRKFCWSSCPINSSAERAYKLCFLLVQKPFLLFAFQFYFSVKHKLGIQNLSGKLSFYYLLFYYFYYLLKQNKLSADAKVSVKSFILLFRSRNFPHEVIWKTFLLLQKETIFIKITVNDSFVFY